MSDPTDCPICARWPPALRATKRQAIGCIPLKQPVCDACVIAFWENVWTRRKSKQDRRRA